jgi:hypothetical protein
MPSSKTHNQLKLLNPLKNISEEFNPKHIFCPILSKFYLLQARQKKPKETHRREYSKSRLFLSQVFTQQQHLELRIIGCMYLR